MSGDPGWGFKSPLAHVFSALAALELSNSTLTLIAIALAGACAAAQAAAPSDADRKAVLAIPAMLASLGRYVRRRAGS